MKSKITMCFAIGLLFLTQLAMAQQKTITGTVVDQSGLALPGVNIILSGTSTGTQTDFDGNYSISASPGQVLMFSFVGLKQVKRTVQAGEVVINLTMELDSESLDEVVVQGYRTSTKEKSSIASVTISASSIENRPNASFVQTLSGQVAGLNISTNSGQPGANSTVNLRGVNSINGNTEPLFIIDGTPVDEDNFRSLNPQDIASISVLKDAGATAIYGNRGANGVVIIETRQGSYNAPLQVNATSILSFSTLQSNDYDALSGPEQLGLERDYGSGRGVGMTDAEIAASPNFDWVDFFFRTGVTKNNTVSLSSGGDKSTQFTSLGFYDAQGILKDSDLKRFNIRNNVAGRSENNRFNYGSNFSINYSTSNEPNNIGAGAINRNYVLGAYQSVPYITPDDYTNGADLLPTDIFLNTPLLLLDRLKTYKRIDEEVKIIGSFNAGYKITDDLAARVVMSADYQSEFATSSEASNSFNALYFGGGGNPLAGNQQQYSTRTFSYNQVTSLNYGHTWGDHTLEAGLYTEYFKAHYRYFGYSADGLDPKTFSTGDGSGFVDDNAAGDFYTDQAFANILNAGLFSYFTQVDYDFKTTYGLTGTVRRDASYRFAGSDKWATFYSVAGRWNISNESFMDGSVFDALKLRASYGTAGNQRISGDDYFSAPDLTRNFYATGTGYAGNNSVFLSQIANTTLKWETVTQANIGLDFEVFSRRLRGSVDVYHKKTSDLFQSTPVSAINATTSINANTGDLYNKGIDLTLNYDVLRGGPEGFNLGVTFVGNYNDNELDNIPNESGELIDTGRNGGPLGEYYTIRYAGVNPANGNVLFYTKDGDVTESPDADTDRVWLGKNLTAEYNGSFGLNMDYKGFFLQTSWNYVIGVDRYDYDLYSLQNRDNIGQFRNNSDILRAWTPDNRITDIPSLTSTNVNIFDSDRYLKNADYVRLRFASIGYAFPRQYLEGAGISSLRIFANGENLVTFSKWRGYDAEATSNSSRIYPTPRVISVGVEIGL
tara:strand:- start:5981 stop:8986 length:3006 start_codon:yes stop_codon:yes gene_type:complete